MNKQSLHQLVQIVIAILTALATSLTAQSCIKAKKARMEPRAAIMAAPTDTEHSDLHAGDIRVLLVTAEDTTCVAAVCTHNRQSF